MKHTILLGVKVRSSRNCIFPLAPARGYRITKSRAYKPASFFRRQAIDRLTYLTTEQAEQVLREPSERSSLIQRKHLRICDHPSLILRSSFTYLHLEDALAELKPSSFRGKTRRADRFIACKSYIRSHILHASFASKRRIESRTIMGRRDKGPSFDDSGLEELPGIERETYFPQNE